MKKNILVILLALMLSSNHYAWAFNTLKDLQEYAAYYTETPSPDNTDWEDPDYTTFHKSMRPSALDRFRYAVGFKQNSQWSAFAFKTLLDEVNQQQKKSRGTGRFVAKISCADDCRFFVWGNLHGAFHSLVRGLTWLADQGIIDQSLTIKKPNYYIVFNGDFIDRTAYTLESLTVALLLIKQNPTNVIYITGKHENKDHWFSYSLRRELAVRAYSVDPKEKVPLHSEISQFFDALPLALYLYAPSNPLDVIRISYRTREDSEINENFMNGFFDATKKSESTLSYYNITKKVPSTSSINIVSIVETEEWRRDIRAVAVDEYGFGLGFLSQDWGSTAWSVLSAPIAANQKFFNFFYDAFIEITTHDPIVKSTITLYNRDIRTADPFKKIGTRNIVTGSDKNLDQVPEFAVTIGSSMSLVQGVPTMGQEVKRGFLLRVGQENRAGGIHGKTIRAIIYNDDYTPAITLTNINRLIKQDKAIAIALTVGTPTISVALKPIENNEISVLFPVTGNSTFRDAKYKGFIHLRASYSDEVRMLIDHVISKTIARKFLFFYQDDSYGLGPLEVAHEELKKRGITEWIDVPYQRNSIDFKSQAQKIKLAQPDAIGLFSTAIATREVIREIGIQFLINTQLFGISFLGEQPFRQYLKEIGLSVLFGAVVPNPKTSDMEIVKEYRKAMDEYNYPYDVFSLEAYIAASILIDAMRKIQKPITREKIMQQLESMNNYNFKGLTLSFNPQHRDLLNTVWIETGDDTEWIKKEIPAEAKKETVKPILPEKQPARTEQPKKVDESFQKEKN